jgi:hypothetical protein
MSTLPERRKTALELIDALLDVLASITKPVVLIDRETGAQQDPILQL